MELVPSVVWFKTWIFDNPDCVQGFYQEKKEQESFGRYIPVTLEHMNQQYRSGVLLFLVDPNMPVSKLLEELNSKLSQLYKPGRMEIRLKQTFFHFYKHSKKVVQLVDQSSLQSRYEQFKDQRGLLSLLYDCREDKMFAPLSGPEKVELAVLVPAIAAYYAYDWAAKNISLPSLPILRPKLHQFEYKAKFSLENRKKKCEAFNEYTGGMTAMIVERHMHSRLPELPSPRFAARSNTTYRQLCLLLNKRILPVLEGPDIVQSIFFVIGRQIPSQEALLADIYKKYKDEDGMLYVTYQEQQSFG